MHATPYYFFLIVFASTQKKQDKPRKITQKQITAFQHKILSFYRKHGRRLPWRRTRDPYKILLSEIMLQQTQVQRVNTYYQKWIHQWPTINDLAQASQKHVLQAWMGLGYNTRAVNLHRTAQLISTKYQGDALSAMNHYQDLPGIGKYTSQAIRIFSTNADIVTIDTNIRRLLIHEFHLPETTSSTELWGLAERCLPKGKSRDWHNALMDYGALILTSRKTGISPLTQQTRFTGSDRQIRGQILRILLEAPTSQTGLQKTLDIESERLKKILTKMIENNLITYQNHHYQVPE
ncbi:MAG: Fe-S cluster assembly protein HesB [Methanobacteriota archaeon]